MLKKLYNWIIRIFTRDINPSEDLNRTINSYDYTFVDDVPDKVESGIVYLICNQGYCWQSVMECPCGCKQALFMNHVEDFKPSWKHEINKQNKITLYPSVDRTVGCKSHFWITDGKIIWVG